MEIKYIKPLVLDSSKQGIWFISDTHFGHTNIIRFCNRPFSSIKEMDETIINNWNSVVKPNDIVFHLGDFAFASNARWKQLIQALNGHIYLIVGNHDEIRYPGHQVFDLFEGVTSQLIVKIDGQAAYLNHYPFLCYGGAYRDPKQAVYALHGHVHLLREHNIGKDFERMSHAFPYQYDVGVDFNNYTPISWNEVCNKITTQVKYNVNQMYWINS